MTLPKDGIKRCGATTRSEDKHPCRRWPMKDSTRCSNHGGKSPRAIKAAADRRTTAKLVKAAEKLTTAGPITDPLRALSQVAGEITAWKDLLRQHVLNLENKLRYSALEGGEQIRGEITLYERALDRAVTVLTAIARLDIDERLVAIDERQAELVEKALLAGLDAAGVTAEQRATAVGALTRHLRVVS